MDDEIRVTITIKKSGTGYTSNHHIEGIDEASAAYILIDVGRNILMVLASHHHGHEHGQAAGRDHASHDEIVLYEQALPSPDADGHNYAEREEPYGN
jgi:hypothetical protein